MEENFDAKCFKSNKMINHTTFGSEPTLHISEQYVGFKIPDKSTVDHSFHGFTDATCQHNRIIIGRICGIITIAFLQSDGKSLDNQILLKIFKRHNREELSRCFSN